MAQNTAGQNDAAFFELLGGGEKKLSEKKWGAGMVIAGITGKILPLRFQTVSTRLSSCTCQFEMYLHTFLTVIYLKLVLIFLFLFRWSSSGSICDMFALCVTCIEASVSTVCASNKFSSWKCFESSQRAIWTIRRFRKWRWKNCKIAICYKLPLC